MDVGGLIMRLDGVLRYIARLFDDAYIVFMAAISPIMYNFFFPEQQYFYGACAVLGLIGLDLSTKLYSLGRISGGMKKAFKERIINSRSLCKGTMDKLLVLGIMLIVCGCAYWLTPLTEVAIWFTQAVFTLMFLRDALSVVENLNDCGIAGMGLFEKIVKKKIDNYCGEEAVDNLEKTTKEDTDEQNTDHL